MRLLNHTLAYLSLGFLVIMAVWGGVFYFTMIDEVQDSTDDGLEDQKELIIYNFQGQNRFNSTETFSNNYRIREIPEAIALGFRDQYSDTLMRTFRDEGEELFRMLTTVFEYDEQYFQLKIVASTLEDEDLLQQLFTGLIWLYVLTVLSILVVNNWVLRKIWAPFYDILNRMKTFRIDQQDKTPVVKSKVKEFQELRDAVDKLLKRSVDAYRHQKQFIENAAHELQTPLAISFNRLELFSEKHDLSSDQMAEIERILENLRRVARLNKSLLMLSRIENRQFGSRTNMSINTLVQELLDDLSDFIEAKQLSVQVEAKSDLQVDMNKDLALMLLSNLLRNAIRHNVSGGEIHIEIGSEYLLISNTGTEVPLQEDRIFQRFFKDSGQTSSNGLGLAIVKAITDFYEMSIQYSFLNNRHQMLVKFT